MGRTQTEREFQTEEQETLLGSRPLDKAKEVYVDEVVSPKTELDLEREREKLQAEVEEARRLKRPKDEIKARLDEIEAIDGYLGKALNVRKESRRFSDDEELARKKVWKAVDDAKKHIAAKEAEYLKEGDLSLYVHLTDSINIRTDCWYEPDLPVDWKF
jgi:hypothetical protein